MLTLIVAIKLVAEIALLALIGQWVLGLLIGARKEQNLFHQVLRQIGWPFLRLARWVSPRVVLDQHLPWVAAFLLASIWLLSTAAKIGYCVRVGVQQCQ